MKQSDQQLFEEFKAFKKSQSEKADQPPKRKVKIRMGGRGDYEEYRKNGAGPKALRRFFRKQKKKQHRISNNGGTNYVAKNQ